jgi:aryl-alcohol dehydrogenase-like predicted oxidoreductase
VSSAIVGARNPSQIEGTIGGADWKLSGAEVAEIEALLVDRNRRVNLA